MRNEDQASRQTQHEARRVDSPLSHLWEILAPISLFVSVYLATFLALGYGALAAGLPFQQWVALISVIVATAATIHIIEGGSWPLGLSAPPPTAILELMVGLGFAVVLVAVVDLLILISTSLRHVRGSGFPWSELAGVFIPAALHEEMAFRGYVFQRLRRWHRGAAVAITSIVFAALHAGNRGISLLAFANLVLAGVLLALAYERFERLWFPIGIHLAWNVLTGPILGYEVSGYVARATLLRTIDPGPTWITGGAFGIEGSVWMGVVEVGGILWMLLKSERRMQNEE